MKLSELIKQKQDFDDLLKEFPEKFKNLYKEELEDFDSHMHTVLYPKSVFRKIEGDIRDTNKIILRNASEDFNMCCSFNTASKLHTEFWIYEEKIYKVSYMWNYELISEGKADFGTHCWYVSSLNTYRVFDPCNIIIEDIEITDELDKSKGLLFLVWEENCFKKQYKKMELPKN